MLARRSAIAMVVGGALLLAVSWVAAAAESVSTAEVDLFRFVNDWPDWLERPIWPLMQFGAIAIVPMVAVAVWFIMRRRRLSIGIAVTAFAAWVLAKGVKALIERGRPQDYLDEVNFRPQWEGLGFVSGHAAVVFAMAAVLSPYLSRPWKVVVWAVAVATGVLRMYTAAHLPLDVTGGAGLGIALAGLWHLAMSPRIHTSSDAVATTRA